MKKTGMLMRINFFNQIPNISEILPSDPQSLHAVLHAEIAVTARAR